jgi:hypothetical protein
MSDIDVCISYIFVGAAELVSAVEVRMLTARVHELAPRQLHSDRVGHPWANGRG